MDSEETETIGYTLDDLKRLIEEKEEGDADTLESVMPRLVLTMMKTLQDQSKLVQQIIDQQADKAKDKGSARDKGRTAKKSAEKPVEEKSEENSRPTEKDSGSSTSDPANTGTGRGRGSGGRGRGGGGRGRGREDNPEEDTTRALSAEVGAGPLCAMNIGNTDATVTAAGITDTTRTTN
uniref:Uncharacterized protein n=1 Tax=Amphimedon queenslandica TaxID=400682 RepID=A0A1X7TJN5_AMPQE